MIFTNMSFQYRSQLIRMLGIRSSVTIHSRTFVPLSRKKMNIRENQISNK